jgi:hypothetical protein
LATITLPKVITPAVVRALEAGMARCYDELEHAQARGAPADVVEQLYQAFIAASDAHSLAVQRLADQSPPMAPAPVVVRQSSLLD